MTEKQNQFCEEYLKDFNATKAAIRAGYSEKTAYSIGNENLKKPEIGENIELRKSKISEGTELTIINLIEDVNEIKKRCLYEKFDPVNALRACELLSKFLIQLDVKQQQLLNRMSDDQLEEVARRILDRN